MLRRVIVLSSIATLLAACHSNDKSPSVPNQAPTALNVTITDQNGGDLVVDDTLVATYTYKDADNDLEGISTFRWLRNGVAIGKTKTYKVTAADAEKQLTFEVTPTAKTGIIKGAVSLSGGLTVDAVTPANVNISGTVTFDRVKATLTGLDYDQITKSPVRKAQLEVLDQGGTVIATATTDTQGKYTVTVASQIKVKIRIRAEMSAYGVKVVDNTKAGALYVLDGSLVSSGKINSTRDLHAPTGWNGSAYTSAADRKAAPFAILDSMYLASEKISVADASVTFAPLTVNWSVDNAPTKGDQAKGQIGTSYYESETVALYILGKENTDTDEFDDHVMLHEWGHYFEDKFSRSDSMGGPHGDGDILDMRIAFGEAWGNALSGMLTNDPSYIDTSGVGQKEVFEINVENTPAEPDPPGFYSESSLQRVLYDLYDVTNTNEVADKVALGFTPIYKTMVGAEKNAPAYTSIFTFITGLKADNPGMDADIDSVVGMENMQPIDDVFGSGQIDDRGGDPNVLPIYTALAPDGIVASSCSVKTFDPANVGNHLSIRRYFSFDIETAGQYKVTVTKTSGSASDPVFSVAQAAPFIADKIKGDNNTVDIQEQSGALAVGKHVMEVYSFASAEEGPDGGDLCFDVKVEPDLL